MARTAERTNRGPRTGPDLLEIPGLGRFLRWRHARTVLQVPLLILSLFVLDDGFFGPQLAPENFAGVLPWVQWRGLLILGLLLAGNLFCMSCPFMLPRRLAKRYLPANRHWPRWLRVKWLAVGLLILFLYSYEAFSLWASPLLTAWVALAYFVAAFVIDGFFQGAAFCKYVCPIGQFNFVNSLVSPLEVKVRKPDRCATCRTKDCIKGRHDAAGRLVQSGCELWLFQERKVGNFDCTFCLDCIHACPHDNVGIMARTPTSELWNPKRRSGVGFLADRPDVAALVLTLVFGAFMNAFAMVNPFFLFAQWLAGLLHTTSREVVLIVVFGGALVAIPLLAAGLAALATKRLSLSTESVLRVGTSFSYGLAPIGLGMWLAHYGFHFMVGGLTVVPVAQSFFADFGLPILGAPRWELGALVPTSWLQPIEGVFLELGLVGSLVTIQHLAEALPRPPGRPAWLSALPWWLVTAALFAAGWWLMSQPMQMRGILLTGG